MRCVMKSSHLGIVIIGRNEGDRLKTCLESVVRQTPRVVYVDSGSSDSSVEVAQTFGIHVFALDSSLPFTAARARNSGFEALIRIYSDTEYVQFVDGDCELMNSWVAVGKEILDGRPKVAVVCGRCRERFPDQSVYNMLCDMDWNSPAGMTDACGGNAMVRVEAFQQVGGFNPTLIAGEEPELCVRLRQADYCIHRADAEMVLHDSAIRHFSKWWTRTMRTGHAYAEGAFLHGRLPQRHCVKETRSAIVWGFLFPCALLVLMLLGFWQPAVALFGVIIPIAYVLQLGRIARGRQRRGDPLRASLTYAFFCVLGKVPESWGAFLYYFNRLRGRRTALIDYKSPHLAP